MHTDPAQCPRIFFRGSLGSGRRLFVAAVSMLLAAFFAPAASASERVWDLVEIDLPSGFSGTVLTNEDNGREEFLFGHPRNLLIFGWFERSPHGLRNAPLNKVSRHVKSEHRANGFRVVPGSERRSRGRWSADFTGRSEGGEYRRRVTIIPVAGGYVVAYTSTPRRDWNHRLADKTRSVVSTLRVLD